MKVDFSRILLDVYDKPIMTGTGVDAKPATLSFICCEALLAPDGEQKDGESKAKQFALALAIVKAAEMEVLPEQAAQLKACIGRVYGPLIVGRAYELLNG